MPVSTYRAGSPRKPNEGLRLGTLRFLPRGVRKTEYARGGWLDVWLPVLAPSAALIKSYRSGPMDEKAFARLAKHYRAEIARRPEARQVLRLLAALSREIPLAVGCTCEDESRCHRSVLVEMIREEARKA